MKHLKKFLEKANNNLEDFIWDAKTLINVEEEYGAYTPGDADIIKAVTNLVNNSNITIDELKSALDRFSDVEQKFINIIINNKEVAQTLKYQLSSSDILNIVQSFTDDTITIQEIDAKLKGYNL